MSSGTSAFTTIIAIMLFVAIYLIPTFIAMSRDHHQIWAITAVNVIIGWTALGWIAALVWSLTAVQKKTEQQQSLKPITPIPGPAAKLLPATKKCPYCAEDIKKAAVVCRFCGHDLSEPKPTAEEVPSTGGLVTPEPEPTPAPTRKLTQEQALELAKRYGIKKSGDKYVYKGEKFSQFADALKYAHIKEQRRAPT